MAPAVNSVEKFFVVGMNFLERTTRPSGGKIQLIHRLPDGGGGDDDDDDDARSKVLCNVIGCFTTDLSAAIVQEWLKWYDGAEHDGSFARWLCDTLTWIIEAPIEFAVTESHISLFTENSPYEGCSALRIPISVLENEIGRHILRAVVNANHLFDCRGQPIRGVCGWNRRVYMRNGDLERSVDRCRLASTFVNTISGIALRTSSNPEIFQQILGGFDAAIMRQIGRLGTLGLDFSISDERRAASVASVRQTVQWMSDIRNCPPKNFVVCSGTAK